MRVLSEGPVSGAISVAAAEAYEFPAGYWAVHQAGSRFLLRSLNGLAALHEDNLASGLIFNAISVANVRHITATPTNNVHGTLDSIPPDRLRRPVSVLALAGLMRLPYETVRRHVRSMLERGVCVRVDSRGIVIPSQIHDHPARHQAIRSGYPNLVGLIDDLERCGFDFEPYRRRQYHTVPTPAEGAVPSNIRALLRVCLEFVADGAAQLGLRHGGDVLKGAVFSAICMANERHAAGELGGPLPDALREPVSTSMLAADLRLPYETARRYAGRLMREGMVERRGKGFVVPVAQLHTPAQLRALRDGYARVAHLVADLRRAGFDFSDRGAIRQPQ